VIYNITNYGWKKYKIIREIHTLYNYHELLHVFLKFQQHRFPHHTWIGHKTSQMLQRTDQRQNLVKGIKTEFGKPQFNNIKKNMICIGEIVTTDNPYKLSFGSS